ncbi:MAG: histidine phosphatase family protein [Planctomycetota bacterium]
MPSSRTPTHVRFIRHAEVAEPHRGTFYGGADVPLSERGARESRQLAEVLAADPPGTIYSSPLGRARLLADALAGHCGAPVVVEHGLAELDRGAWTHLTIEQVEAKWPGAVQRYIADPEGGHAHEGERESELCARVWGAVDRIVEAGPGERYVFVAHAHVLRVVMRRLQGWSASESLQRFVPTLGVVEASLWPGGGEVLSAPEQVGQSLLMRP